MIDTDDVATAATVGGAFIGFLAVGGSIYNVVINPLGTRAAFTLSLMGVAIVGVLVLVIRNRARIKQMEGDSDGA